MIKGLNINICKIPIIFIIIEIIKAEQKISKRNYFSLRNYKGLKNKKMRKTNEINCNNIDNCIKCNSPNYNCIYENGICKYSNSNDNWYIKLNSCKNESNYTLISEKYCGKFHREKNNIKLIDSDLVGNNNKFEIFCIWDILKENFKKIEIKIQNNDNNSKLGYLIYDENKEKFIEINYRKTIKKKYFSIDKITLYYYNSYLPTKNPFNINIKINNSITFNQIILYLLIAFGSIFIIIFLFIIISFSKKISIKNKNQNIKSSINAGQFKTILYSQNISIFNKSCPICLEEFKINKVIVILKCNHGYHINCIKSWIDKNSTKNIFCPICLHKFNQFEHQKENYHLNIRNSHIQILNSHNNDIS